MRVASIRASFRISNALGGLLAHRNKKSDTNLLFSLQNLLSPLSLERILNTRNHDLSDVSLATLIYRASCSYNLGKALTVILFPGIYMIDRYIQPQKKPFSKLSKNSTAAEVKFDV